MRVGQHCLPLGHRGTPLWPVCVGMSMLFGPPCSRALPDDAECRTVDQLALMSQWAAATPVAQQPQQVSEACCARLYCIGWQSNGWLTGQPDLADAALRVMCVGVLDTVQQMSPAACSVCMLKCLCPPNSHQARS